MDGDRPAGEERRRRASWRAAAEQLRRDGRHAEADAVLNQLDQVEREGEQGRDPHR
jgi:hypothetical protein